MKRFGVSLIMIGLSALLFWGCPSKKTPSVGQASGNDSTKNADSTAQSIEQARDTSLSYEQRQGKYLYTKYCVVCHGDDGKGTGFNAFNLDPKPRDFTDSKIMSALTDDQLIQTITNGGRSVNKSPQMPAWSGRMTKEEIRYLLAYVKAFSANRP